MSEIINNVLSIALSFLPNDPLYNYISSISLGLLEPNWLRWLNWFFPIHDIIVVFGLWLSAVLIYLAIKFFISAFEAFTPM